MHDSLLNFHSVFLDTQYNIFQTVSECPFSHFKFVCHGTTAIWRVGLLTVGACWTSSSSKQRWCRWDLRFTQWLRWGSLELLGKRLALSRASSSLLKILMSSCRSQSSLSCFVASQRNSLGNLSIKIGVNRLPYEPESTSSDFIPPHTTLYFIM
jgi:hypothetical protein